MRIEKLKISDFDKLIALQEKHIVHNLTLEQQAAQGFVTTRLDVELLTQLHSDDMSFVLYDGSQLGAYVIGASWAYCKKWKLFEHMVERFSEIDTVALFNGEKITEENSFQYGPVCIDNDFRGRGVLKLLFDAVSTEGVGKYKFVSTFINKRNELSLAAHKKNTPLIHFDTFEFNNNTYYSFASLTNG